MSRSHFGTMPAKRAGVLAAALLVLLVLALARTVSPPLEPARISDTVSSTSPRPPAVADSGAAPARAAARDPDVEKAIEAQIARLLAESLGSDAVEAERGPVDPVRCRVTVQDREGRPLPGARLAVDGVRNDECFHDPVPWDVLADGTRTASTEGWEPTIFVAWHPYVAGSAWVKVETRQAAADVQLVLPGEPRGALDIQAVRPAGLDWLRLVVVLRPLDGGEVLVHDTYAAVRPLEHGRPPGWQAGGLAPGRWEVSGASPAHPWRARPQEVEVVCGETRPVRLELQPAPVLEGVTLDTEGQPLANMALELVQSHARPAKDDESWPEWGTRYHDREERGGMQGLHHWTLSRHGMRMLVTTGPDGRFHFHGFEDRPIGLRVEATVKTDARWTAADGYPGAVNAPPHRSACLVRREVRPGPAPIRIEVPSRAGTLDVRIAGPVPAGRPSLRLDGRFCEDKFVSVAADRIRIDAVDVGTHALFLEYHGPDTRCGAVARVDVCAGEISTLTMTPQLLADLRFQRAYEPGAPSDGCYAAVAEWEGREVCGIQSEHIEVPAGVPLTVTLRDSKEELIPVSVAVLLRPGEVRDVGRLTLRARPPRQPLYSHR